MKLFRIFLLLTLSAFEIIAGNYKGEVLFETKTLKEQNDSLFLVMDIHIHSFAVNDCQSLIITPVLETEVNSIWLPYVQVNGNNKRQMIKRWESLRGKNRIYEKPYLVKNINNGEPELLEYSIAIPYEQWMDSARFIIREDFRDCAGEKRLYIFSQPHHIELEMKEPYIPDLKITYLVPPPEQKQRKIQGQAYLDFQVGRSVIIPGFRRNPEELARIAATINDIKDNPDVNITGLFIEGYASPEGSYATNDRLSRERANALKEYIQTNFGISHDQFTVGSVAEDWIGLKELVGQSDISQKQKILEIIDSDIDLDRKEQLLKNLGSPYRVMLNEMFPQLRRVEYQVNFTVKEYSTDEAKDLVGKNPEHLSHRELFMLAGTYAEDSSEFNNIMETIIRLYPEDTFANINTAALLLSRGENNSAKRYLDKVGDIPDSFNIWGVYYMNTGDLDKAEEYFMKASGSGQVDSVINLHELELKKKDNERMERYNKRQK